ncbi:MAG: hemerythrin family protein [Rhodospirillaceae bacterium]|jgi:hemerythrin-like metal-binding protein
MSENFDEFDHQHRQLLNQIDLLCERLKITSLEHEKIFLISEIHAVAAAHFKKEESFMKQHHDSNFTSHKIDHDGLLAEIKKHMDMATKPDNGNLGQILSQLCHRWFAVHFDEYDRPLVSQTADS